MNINKLKIAIEELSKPENADKLVTFKLMAKILEVFLEDDSIFCKLSNTVSNGGSTWNEDNINNLNK
jgi:hypothetical protein